MKIVLPLAGKGSRLLPHTEFIPKPLMYLAGQTILDYLMDKLIPLNPSEFVFITGYLQDQIKDHLTLRYPDLSMRFIEQKNPQGLGHAIYQARDAFAKDEDMLVVLGDQIFEIDWAHMIDQQTNCLAVSEVQNPSSFGVVVVNDEGFITEMEEKPEHPKSNLAISGIYYFMSAQSVFSTISYQIAKDIRTKGEIQITDSMKLMLESGESFKTVNITDWNDCGNHEDLLCANQILLKSQSIAPDFDYTVEIIPPVCIDSTAVISNSKIGPFVSVGAGSIIKDSVIINSVISEKSEIINCDLEKSYLGSGIKISDLNDKDQYLV